jgi:hypothetical protein
VSLEDHLRSIVTTASVLLAVAAFGLPGQAQAAMTESVHAPAGSPVVTAAEPRDPCEKFLYRHVHKKECAEKPTPSPSSGAPAPKG